MPRAGWVKPESDRRLSDLVSVGVLTRVFPPEVVDEVIAEVGRTEQRHRSLPARVVAYFAVGMALYSDGSYEDVLAQLTDGLSWSSRWAETYVAPSKSAIFQARARLGCEPVEALFRRVAVPLASEATPGSWLAGRRLVAIDGTCLDVADTVENARCFGRPGVNKGEQAAFPQARVVALAECGTHAMFDAVVGAYTTPELTLGWPVDRTAGAGDVGASPTVCSTGSRCGARLQGPVRTCCGGRAKDLKPRHLETLPDGSWLAEVRPGGNAGTATPSR